MAVSGLVEVPDRFVLLSLARHGIKDDRSQRKRQPRESNFQWRNLRPALADFAGQCHTGLRSATRRCIAVRASVWHGQATSARAGRANSRFHWPTSLASATRSYAVPHEATAVPHEATQCHTKLRSATSHCVAVHASVWHGQATSARAGRANSRFHWPTSLASATHPIAASRSNRSWKLRADTSKMPPQRIWPHRNCLLRTIDLGRSHSELRSRHTTLLEPVGFR